MNEETSTNHVAEVTSVGATAIGKTGHITNRFFRPTVTSTFVAEHDANGTNAEDQEELEMRQSRLENLRQRKTELQTLSKASKRAYNDFRSLSDQFLEADNARVPNAEQTEIINSLQTTVSSIVLAGADAAGTARQQTASRIAKHLAALKDQRDLHDKEWDSCINDIDAAKAALEKVKKRTGATENPIVDGRVVYCPFRGGSMCRDSNEVIIEIWGSINGPPMLDLNFSRLHRLVSELKKSLLSEVRNYPYGELTIHRILNL